MDIEVIAVFGGTISVVVVTIVAATTAVVIGVDIAEDGDAAVFTSTVAGMVCGAVDICTDALFQQAAAIGGGVITVAAAGK